MKASRTICSSAAQNVHVEVSLVPLVSSDGTPLEPGGEAVAAVLVVGSIAKLHVRCVGHLADLQLRASIRAFDHLNHAMLESVVTPGVLAVATARLDTSRSVVDVTRRARERKVNRDDLTGVASCQGLLGFVVLEVAPHTEFASFRRVVRHISTITQETEAFVRTKRRGSTGEARVERVEAGVLDLSTSYKLHSRTSDARVGVSVALLRCTHVTDSARPTVRVVLTLLTLENVHVDVSVRPPACALDTPLIPR
mmetsp:Transcript_4375/g.5842  ORF Transcript_4375/g.5842 Transcript_4375/m.5842 type:complete len:253 (+) Transcript_4375:291-1049(+)